MSGTEPAAPQSRELEIMRVLFERRLKDRAIALADSRWPGSGKMVDLAYEWGQLKPAERRERLNAIGPEEIARLREFAELNPELSKAVTELDRRGVLPRVEAAAADIAAARQEVDQRAAPDAAPAQEASAPAQPPEEAAESQVPAEAAVAASDTSEDTPSEIEQPAQPVAEPLGIDEYDVDMPELDLGLPSTNEFLSSEQERRTEAAKAADEAMDRVRKSLDQATQRAFDRSASFGSPRMPEISRPTLPSAELTEQGTTTTASAIRAIDAPAALARHLENHAVARLRPGDPMPTIDQLVSLANDLQIGFTEHTVTFSNRREVFGGLVSEFGSIEVRPGTIPKAIAGPNLVVIRGRLSPQLADRIEEGFFDIPGTRASVKVHPRAKVVVLGEG